VCPVERSDGMNPDLRSGGSDSWSEATVPNVKHSAGNYSFLEEFNRGVNPGGVKLRTDSLIAQNNLIQLPPDKSLLTKRK